MRSRRGERDNPSAPSTATPKYARPERERRFALAGAPDGDVVKTVEITDRYLRETRLRLRQAVERSAFGSTTIYKLTQKVPTVAGGPLLITTLYLDQREYRLLQAIPAAILRKTRLSIPPFGIDIFHGPLEGLVLAEVEFDSDDAQQSFVPTIPVVAELTGDWRFTGARLATASADDIAADLRPLGDHLRHQELPG
jgi:hypothetical protein